MLALLPFQQPEDRSVQIQLASFRAGRHLAEIPDRIPDVGLRVLGLWSMIITQMAAPFRPSTVQASPQAD